MMYHEIYLPGTNEDVWHAGEREADYVIATLLNNLQDKKRA